MMKDSTYVDIIMENHFFMEKIEQRINSAQEWSMQNTSQLWKKLMFQENENDYKDDYKPILTP